MVRARDNARATRTMRQSETRRILSTAKQWTASRGSSTFRTDKAERRQIDGEKSKTVDRPATVRIGTSGLDRDFILTNTSNVLYIIILCRSIEHTK